MNDATGTDGEGASGLRISLRTLLILSTLGYLPLFAFRPLSRQWLQETGITPLADGFFYAYVALMIGQWVLYALGLRRLQSGTMDKRSLLPWAFGLAALMCMVWPVVSSDHFQYLSQGRVFAVFGANPYTEPYASFPEDPLFEQLFTSWAPYPTPYGPLVMYASAIPAWLAGNHLMAGLALSKFGYLLVYCATLFMVWRRVPDARSFFLFAFNPLVLTEFLVNAHNDLLMVFFLALGWFLSEKANHLGWALAAFWACALATLVKITALVLLPFIGLYLMAGLDGSGRRTAFVVLSVVGVACLFAGCYLPFWEGSATLLFPFSHFPVLTASGKHFPSWIPGLAMLFMEGDARETFELVRMIGAVLLSVALAGLGLKYVWEVFHGERGRLPVHLSWACIFFLLLSPNFLPWYVCLGVWVWTVAAARLPAGRKTPVYATLVFTFMGVMNYLTLR